MSVSSVKNWRDESPVWGKQTIQKTPTAAVRQLDLLPGIEPGRFSQWPVSIKSKIPSCYNTASEHCEKNVRDSPDFSRWSGRPLNQPFIRPCQKCDVSYDVPFSRRRMR